MRVYGLGFRVYGLSFIQSTDNDKQKTINKNLKTIILFFFITILFSCSDAPENRVVTNGKDTLKEHLMEANKIVSRDESNDIDDFILRHQWKMKRTGTGLRYFILENGKGKQASADDEIKMSYDIFLLDGSKVGKRDTVIFAIGKSEAPSGLQEAALLLHEGDKARLIVPYHLAYGLTGDAEKKIPAKATLVFSDLTVLSVLSNEKK